ncbi:NACHT domain-containing protein [Streptomyces erythrochromogenes]|uniref:NACHT domain-containing protein n=1 Tax=Streptomyces erythrochromogenes TaxID=285574 RepID=UPI0033EAE3BD
MDRLIAEPVDPARVTAVLVGIEVYADGDWYGELRGPARDALRFAEWLRARDVPAENITLLLAPTPDFAAEADVRAASLGVSVSPATADLVRKAFTGLDRNRQLLFTYWGGHGVIAPSTMRRHLVLSESTERDPQSVLFDDLRRYLACEDEEHLDLTRQIFIIDTCGWYLKRREREPVPRLFPQGELADKEVDQYVLFASRDGQGAINDSGLGTTEFAQQVLGHLHSGPPVLPPDVEELTRRVDGYFSDPVRATDVTQTPVSIHTRSYAGSERDLGSPFLRERRVLPVAPVHLRDALGRLHERSTHHIGRFALSKSGIGAHAGLHAINVGYATVDMKAGIPKRAAYATVRHFYDAIPDGRLVVRGPAGSGKTVLAVHLATELLENRAKDEPVPVLLTLVNWRTPPPDSRPDGSQAGYDRLVRYFEGWLAGQLLTQKLCDDAQTARELVEGRWLLPVLDGLDEVHAPREAEGDGPAGYLVAAIDRYLTAGSGRPAPVVVTVRGTGDDESRPGPSSACVVEMQRLSVPEIVGALTDGVPGYPTDEEWEALRADLRLGEGSTAVRRLDSPWKVVLAVKAVTGPRPQVPVPELVHALVRTGDGADEALHERLLAAFVPAACADAVVAEPRPPDAPTAVRWLAELARHLGRHTSEDLTLSRMWVIAGERRVRTVQAVAHVVIVLFFCVACLLAAVGGPGHAAATAGQLIDGTADLSGATGRRLWAAAAFSVVVTVAAAATGMAHRTWVPVVKRRTRGLRERFEGPKRSRLPLSILSGLEIGGAIGLAFGLGTFLLFGPLTGLVVGGVIGVALGYGMEAKVGLDRTLSGNFFPAYYWMWDGLGLLAGAVTGSLVFRLVGYAPLSGAAFGAAVGFFAAFAVGLIGWLRYVIAMTMMKRCNLLPWKVAAFLDWGHRAGVLRVHGVSWQFRHAELQHWLAAQVEERPPRSRPASSGRLRGLRERVVPRVE